MLLHWNASADNSHDMKAMLVKLPADQVLADPRDLYCLQLSWDLAQRHDYSIRSVEGGEDWAEEGKNVGLEEVETEFGEKLEGEEVESKVDLE